MITCCSQRQEGRGSDKVRGYDMNDITLLSQDTIDKIAAGEVVERPASVVKELVENAVDAGANAVTVEIRDGGISLVRITDNGCGIPKEQVALAYMRHATSKIRQVEDLLTSGTLGFRGEALSSIAAVSQVEMITKTAGSLTGVRYVIEGGVEQSMEEIGAPEGTTFLIHNLFYNTPVRKKFLKSAVTEAGYVSELMERMALSHPNIAFKFINNRDTKLHTSGNCNLKDIIYGIYGRDIAANLVRVESDYGNIRISGFIGKPAISRGNRNYENYFVNGRYVKNAIVARAIEDAYKAFMMNHRYPFTALMIQIDTEEVDVNVHPQKLEVRFSDQQAVYERVCQTVKEALLGKELIPEFTTDRPVTQQKPAIQQKSAVQQELAVQQKPAVQPQKAAAEKERPLRYPEPFEKMRSKLLAEANSPYEVKYPQRDRRASLMKPVTGTVVTQTPNELLPAPFSASEKSDKKSADPIGKAAALEAVREEAARVRKEEEERTGVQMELFGSKLLEKESRPRHKLIGQVFETYWIVEFEEKLYIIDQHAAHEKVMYERLMREYQEKRQTSQRITPPVIVTLNLQEEALLNRHLKTFQSVGFDIAPFGGREYAISAVPGNLYGLASRDLFIEMLDGLSGISEQSSNRLICEKIASMSCKAAVKGKHSLSAAEANALIEELLTLENPYNCPHGRPTIIAMTKYELEKKFKRIQS